MWVRRRVSNAQVVGYRGSAPLLTDLIGGQVAVPSTPFDTILPQHEAGKLRVLAVSERSARRMRRTIPTFKEAGLDLVATGWNAFFAPASMPKDKVDLLARRSAKSWLDPDTAAQVHRLKMSPSGEHAGADAGDAQGVSARSGRR
jgi:tripartite-type tricarboxylate transporter receptor subunit TctC